MSVVANVTTSRDLLRSRKLPSSQTALQTLCTSFFTLLSASNSPPAALLRAGFLPALLGTDARSAGRNDPLVDEEIRLLLANPPNVRVVQGLIGSEQCAAAWAKVSDSSNATASNTMMDSIFLPFAVHQEVEQAKADGEKEEEAALNMMVLACVTYELAHWIYVKTHGYRPLASAQDSMSMLSASTSITSMASVQSLLLSPPRSTDVGVLALSALFGANFECLTYAIGERQVIKRRIAGRRSPSLTPPLVYSLIFDSPRIHDATLEPPTHARWIPSFKADDSSRAELCMVVAAFSATSGPGYHGRCEVREADAVSEYQISLNEGQSGGKQ